MPTAEHTQRWFRFGASSAPFLWPKKVAKPPFEDILSTLVDQRLKRLNRSNDSPDLAHGFVFFVFCWFSRGFGQTAKNHGKTKKKSSDPCPLPGLSPDLAHGSELFVFFLVFCVFFSIVVLHVFHVKMLSSQYLSKKKARLYNLHTCAPQAKLQKKTWKKQKSFIDLYND